MPETLTESFCERCGTRYTFESARPKVRLKGVKVLSRGLKNFVFSDDTTMDEAMAAARSETDREVTAHQLDAFHKTFNFCMSCRQYTCPNCWNEVEARCQSCAPLAMPEIAPVTFPGLMTLAERTIAAEPTANGTNGHDHDATAAVEADATAEGTTAAVEAEPSAVEPGAVAAEAVAAEAVAAEAVAAGPVADGAAAGPAAKANGQTAGLLQRFRPGQSLDDELAAFERDRAGAAAGIVESRLDEVTTPPETEAAAIEVPVEAIPEAPVEATVEVVEATAEPVETVAAEPLEARAEEPVEVVVEAPAEEPVEAIAAEPEPVAPSAADVVEQPTWRITAPDVEAPTVGMPAPGDAAIPLQANRPAPPSAEPQWPEWPAPQASAGLPFLGRPAQPQGGVESLWAASNQELVATTPVPGRLTSGIQPCISCGLSLSATARFCRRCGTLQAR